MPSIRFSRVYAQRKKELNLLIEETISEPDLWYASPDGVEGRQRALHSKSVLFSGKKKDKFKDLEAGQNNSVLETTMMMAENLSALPLNEAEMNEESQTPVDPLSAEIEGSSHDSWILLVSCASREKI